MTILVGGTTLSSMDRRRFRRSLMGQSVEEVKTELELLFSDKFAASPYFNTYCQIGGYLSSVDNCPRQLKQLNDEMQRILDHRLADIRVRIVKEVGGTIAPSKTCAIDSPSENATALIPPTC